MANQVRTYSLVLIRGEHKGRSFPLEMGTNIIGRWDPEVSAFPEIDLEDLDSDGKVSRKHALVKVSDEKVTIEDLGSLNGTFVNRSEKLGPGEVVTLALGDEVIVGKFFLELQVNSST